MYIAQANNITKLEQAGNIQPLIIHLRPITTGKVLYIPPIGLQQNLGMPARDRHIVNNDITFGTTP